MPTSPCHPIAETVARAGAAHEWLTLSVETVVPAGWLRCSDVDDAEVRRWEELAAAEQRREFGREHAMTATGYVLGWYADIAAALGALCFATDRRVPRLDRDVVAFRRAPEGYPDAVALLDPRFWCLPNDPAADHPDATAVPDQTALAEILRAEVRRHADDFLAGYNPGAKLPRRNLLGAFFDGLDSGFWRETTEDAARDEVIGLGLQVLPGDTREFADASTYSILTDRRGRAHLTRLRVSCCYYYKVGTEGPCTSCPRTSEAERLDRYSAYPDPT